MEKPKFLQNARERAEGRFETAKSNGRSGYFRDVTVQYFNGKPLLTLIGRGMLQVLDCLEGKKRPAGETRESNDLFLQYRPCGSDVWELGDDRSPIAYLEYLRYHHILIIYAVNENINSGLGAIASSLPAYKLKSNDLPYEWI